MADVAAERRLAVLIDGDNFSSELAAALFNAVSKLGTVAIRRVYGRNSGIANWRAAAEKFDLGLHEVTPGKNAADMKLAIDAMDIHHRGKMDGYCIVSSDSDFAELARRLREDGVTVNGFGESKAAPELRKAYDSFVVLGEPAAVNPAGQPTVVKTQPNVRAWLNLLAQVLVSLPAGTARISLDDLSQQVRQLDKTFSAKKYGAKNFKALVLTSGLELKKTEGGWNVLVPPTLSAAA